LEQSRRLYLLYFSHLERELERVGKSFKAVLDVIFEEPLKMDNSFTCFAFSLIMSSQFRDEKCWNIYKETYIDYSMKVMVKWLNICIERGYVEHFDVSPVALGILYHSFAGINLTVEKLMGRELPYEHTKAMQAYKDYILFSLRDKIKV
jgi:hypothetical protein